MSEALVVDVAIVGGGPAGLSAAMALRRRGVGRVVVLEREGEAGGVPRHCGHPPFGIREFGRLLTGPAYARRLVAAAERHGVEIRLRHSVVRLDPGGRLGVMTPDGPLEIVAKRVLLATGTREAPRSARLVTGDRPLGVLNTGALQAYLYLKGLVPFRRPVIVGTELVGLSAILSCLRHGIRPAAIIEAEARPIARWPLGLFPRLMGIPVHYNSHVADIAGLPRVERVTVAAADGRRVEIACDGVLFTGRFTPESSLLRASALAVDAKSGGPAVDAFGRCSDPAYFAAGNLLRPVETAGWCFREGRRIGNLVADDLASMLPPASIAVEAGAGVKYVVPQRVAADAPLPQVLQLRATRPVRGRLTVRCDGKVLWSRPLRAALERRILVKLSEIALPADARSIVLSIEPPA